MSVRKYVAQATAFMNGESDHVPSLEDLSERHRHLAEQWLRARVGVQNAAMLAERPEVDP